MNRVVITGLGWVTPMGHSIESVWKRLVAGESGISQTTIFDAATFPTSISAEVKDYRLSDLMQTFWTNFAKSGDPNSAGVPHWPAYDAAGNWQVMHLGENSAAQPDKHRDRYVFLYQVWGH